MGMLKPLAKTLGPLGYMPSPKLKTLVPLNKLRETIQISKTSLVKFKYLRLKFFNFNRVDQNLQIRCIFGKRSYSEDALIENYKAIVEAINAKKPDTIKKNFIKEAHVSTNHGPAIKINPLKISKQSKLYEFAQ